MTKIIRPASDTLATLNGYVSTNEQAAGPLTAMGTAGNSTQLTFDDGADFPPKVAVIVKDTDAVPANSTKVCSGSIYVENAETACSAYRPN